MDKILIRLFVPAAQRNFDLFVPVTLEIEALTRLISDGVDEIAGGNYTASHEEMLNLTDPDMLLDPKRTLFDYGIRDGAQLVLL